MALCPETRPREESAGEKYMLLSPRGRRMLVDPGFVMRHVNHPAHNGGVKAMERGCEGFPDGRLTRAIAELTSGTR